MAELTHPLRRTLMATLAATGMAAIAVTTVACAPVSSGTDSSDDASASSDAAADSDSSSPSTTESSDSGSSGDAADGKNSDSGASVGTLPSNKVLPKAMSGQEAIDALGDKIDVVAKRVGKTPEELKELLLRDKSARVTPEGNIRYHD